MYTRCLFCQADLGRNEVLEAFPVGRRLAFDVARGRLWVVCRGCERWNLTPLDSRWEAIEDAERRFRETRLRVSTDQIGLARLREGLELVRIGEPLRPEFAAWRYGDQFGRRRRRQIAWTGAGIAAVGAVIAGGMSAGVGIGSFWWIARGAVRRVVQGNPSQVVAKLKVAQSTLAVTRRDIASVRIDGDPDRPFTIEVPNDRILWRIDGGEALRAVGQLLPAVNRFGGGAADVRAAVDAVDRDGGAEGYVDRLRRRAAATRTVDARGAARWWIGDEIPQTGLYALSRVDRLALEMAAHEEQERAALGGELAALEQSWRDAEEIAGIADGLLLPESVRTRFAALRRG